MSGNIDYKYIKELSTFGLVPTKEQFRDYYGEGPEDEEPKLEQGIKHDDGKTRVDLLDAEWLEGVGRILAFGAKKYAAHNWRGGISYSRLIGAALRHILAFNKGRNWETDSETGESHLLHAACCLMFLYWMNIHRKDLDDRYQSTESTASQGNGLSDFAGPVPKTS